MKRHCLVLAIVGVLPAVMAFCAQISSPVELDDGGLSVVFSPKTGWPSEVRVKDEVVLGLAEEVPACLPNVCDIDPFVDIGSSRPDRVSDVQSIGVIRLDRRTAKASVRCGPWIVDCFVELHPEEMMIRRWYEIGQDLEVAKTLKYVWTSFGKLPASKKCGEYFFPTAWPPRKYSLADGSAEIGRLGRGVHACPALIASGCNGWTAVVVPNLLPEYADRAAGSVVVSTNGWVLLSRHDVLGRVKKGEKQRFGDDWLVLRKGKSDDALEAMHDWHRVCGQRIPSDRTADLRHITLYSHHPCGTGEIEMSLTNRLDVSISYLPYLKALGVDTIWLRPIENGNLGYCPNDYYRIDARVGTEAQVRDYIDLAHQMGFRVWRDAVMHGGRNDSLRALAHPEWLAWVDETGRTYDYWCYDFFWPTWVTYFSDMIRNQTRLFNLDGWREDVPIGSKTDNWNPAIPYARASFARLQGGLAQQRAIRAALRDVNPMGATFAESNEALHGNTSDAIYDQAPCHTVFPTLRECAVNQVVADFRRFLHEQQLGFLEDQIWSRYPESHDSVRASLLYGQDCANALMAICAWSRNFPMLCNGGEEGCFEAWRRIFRIRKSLPELIDGTADYLSVRAPNGVFAALRALGKEASVVLVNLNGFRVCGPIKWSGGTFMVDLPGFGYEVVRVKGASVKEIHGDDIPAFEPRVEGRFGLPRAENIGDWTIYRFPGATRWFAHAADGSFDSPWFCRYPGVGVHTPRDGFRPRDGRVCWDSSVHPFGFTRDHAAVGAIAGDQAVELSGFSAENVVQVWDSVTDENSDWEGVAIAIRGPACGVVVRERSTAEALSFRESGVGDDRIVPMPGGWQYEEGRMRVRFLRNGAIVGVWRRDGDLWKQLAGEGTFWTNSGRVEPECTQAWDHEAVHHFEKDDKGHLKFVVSDGCLHPKNNRGPTKIHYETTICFDGGDEMFRLSGRMSYRNIEVKPRAAWLRAKKVKGPVRCEWRFKDGVDGKVGLDIPATLVCDPEKRHLEFSTRIRLMP